MRVPVYDIPRVSEVSRPTAELKHTTTVDYGIEYMAQEGKAAQQFGSALSQLGENLSRQADETVVMGANNRASEISNTIQAEFAMKQGEDVLASKDGVAFPERLTAELQKRLEKVRKSLHNPRQREAFNKHVLAEQSQLHSWGSKHMVQQHLATRQNELVAAVANAQQAAAQNFDNPERVTLEHNKARAALSIALQEGGHSQEVIEQKLRENDTNFHSKVIKSAIENNRVDVAAAYLKKHGKEMDELTRVDLEKTVVATGNMQMATVIAQAYVDGEWGPKANAGTHKAHDIERDIVKNYGHDPALADQIRAAVKRDLDAYYEQKKQGEAQAVSGAIDMLDKGTPIELIMIHQSITSLPTAKQYEVAKVLYMSKDERNAARNYPEYFEDMNNPNLGGLPREVIMAKRALYGKAQFETLYNRWETLNTPGKTPGEKYINDRLFNTVLAKVLGPDIDLNKLDPRAKASKEKLFWKLTEARNEYAARLGRQLTIKEEYDFVMGYVALEFRVKTWGAPISVNALNMQGVEPKNILIPPEHMKMVQDWLIRQGRGNEIKSAASLGAAYYHLMKAEHARRYGAPSDVR